MDPPIQDPNLLSYMKKKQRSFSNKLSGFEKLRLRRFGSKMNKLTQQDELLTPNIADFPCSNMDTELTS